MKIVITSSGYLSNWGGGQRYTQAISKKLNKEYKVVVC